MSQQYFCPAEYILSQKLTLTNPNPKVSCFIGFRVSFFLLVLGFVLVVYSAGQKYRWLIFVVAPVVI